MLILRFTSSSLCVSESSYELCENLIFSGSSCDICSWVRVVSCLFDFCERYEWHLLRVSRFSSFSITLLNWQYYISSCFDVSWPIPTLCSLHFLLLLFHYFLCFHQSLKNWKLSLKNRLSMVAEMKSTRQKIAQKSAISSIFLVENWYFDDKITHGEGVMPKNRQYIVEKSSIFWRLFKQSHFYIYLSFFIF